MSESRLCCSIIAMRRLPDNYFFKNIKFSVCLLYSFLPPSLPIPLLNICTKLSVLHEKFVPKFMRTEQSAKNIIELLLLCKQN